MALRRLAHVLLFALTFLAGCTLGRSTELTYHSYVHNPSGKIHYVLHLADYKKGLFFGSCGPATRSLQWEYSLELAGPGPSYGKNEITVKDGNFRVIAVTSGSVLFDETRHMATFDLALTNGSKTTAFIGNGAYRPHKEN